MIYLAVTAAGLSRALEQAKDDDFIWCGSDAITHAEFAANAPRNVTRFVYSIAEPGRLDDALNTIEEHHPSETVWIEQVTPRPRGSPDAPGRIDQAPMSDHWTVRPFKRPAS
ncbi:hypothetical protein [Roseateles sp. L2-2]|uniref:hypothetical protein n=1 Tax=Roseateles sp. L2-2 TaxID=3422597 RepID=UPI003D3650E6